ncbi:hypothetical protein TNCV_4586631 [Trichonephila clavipes]|nr:hypothetical protein TNCV_4586631 [Trichonephila clavipes]
MTNVTLVLATLSPNCHTTPTLDIVFTLILDSQDIPQQTHLDKDGPYYPFEGIHQQYHQTIMGHMEQESFPDTSQESDVYGVYVNQCDNRVNFE